MTTYDDLTQAAAALADPTTTPHDLMSIAKAYPTLWVDVAKHPNAYPDLLSWLKSVGDDTVREAIAARDASPGIPTPQTPPADEHPLDESPVGTDTESDSPSASPDNPTPDVETSPKKKPSWVSISKGKKILIGSGAGLLAVILAVVLIVTLVVIPHQRAEEAAAAEQARLEQEHQAAVDAFTKAVDSCTQANKSLTDSIAHAQQTATTDPSTLDDPSLIDSLNQAITTAQSVKTCVPPTMADDTATIQEQTTQLTTYTATVTTSVSTLTTADQSVTTSVQTKKDKDAAAKAAEEAAEAAKAQAVQKGDFTITDRDGYTYRFVFDATVDTSIDTTQGKPGTVLVAYDMGDQTKVTITNTTSGKSAPFVSNIRMEPIYSNNPCEIIDIYQGCGHEQIGGTEYWTVSRLYLTWDNIALTQGPFDVNGSWTSDWRGNPPSTEVPQGVSQELSDALSSPAAFIVYEYQGWGDLTYICANDTDSICVLGGSDSLKQ